MTPTWQTDDGRVKLWLGDCLDVLPTLAAGSVDAVVTDPPYGITANEWDTAIDLPSFWNVSLSCCKESAAIVATASQPFSSALVMSNVKLFRHEWIWLKDKGSNFANTIREPFKEHEHVLVFSRGKWTYNKQPQPRAESGKERARYSVTWDSKSTNYRAWDKREGNRIMPESRVPSSWQPFGIERGIHPTQKPVDLFAYLVATYSNPGELVCDPFMGSGTTGIAAVRLGRGFVGIESEPEHFENAKQRIKDELKQLDKPTYRQSELIGANP